MSNRVPDNGWVNSVRYAIYHHSSDCLLRGVLLSGWRVRVWFRWVAGSAQPGAVGGRNLRITLWLVGQPAGSGWAVLWTDILEHDAAETQMSGRTPVPNTHMRATKFFAVLRPGKISEVDAFELLKQALGLAGIWDRCLPDELPEQPNLPPAVPSPYEPDFGRDIALRCPRPRISGRHHCAAERGTDGAARRPYQVQGSKRDSSIGEIGRASCRERV